MQRKTIFAVVAILVIVATVALKANFLDTNVYTLDFAKEWETVQQEIEGIDKSYIIKDFSMEFQKDGTLDFMEYQIIGGNPNNYIHYLVKIKPKSKDYIIEDQKVKQYLQYDQYLPAVDFFNAMNNIELEKLIPNEDCAWYFIRSTGRLANYAVKELEKYVITKEQQLIEITDEQLPIEGYYVTCGGFKKVSETKFVGLEEVDYFFKVMSPDIQDQTV